MSRFSNFVSNFFSKQLECKAPATVKKQSDDDDCFYSFTADYLDKYSKNLIYHYETFAHRSLFTGEYIYCTEFNNKERALAKHLGVDLTFKDFDQAYQAFCELEQKGAMDDYHYLMACKSLVIIFNIQYTRHYIVKYKDFKKDYPRFFTIVRRMLMFDLPLLIKADLYRQICLFKKSVELLNKAFFKTDFERELCDEIRYRSCKSIRYPFMIYEVDNLRKYCYATDRPNNLDWYFWVYY